MEIIQIPFEQLKISKMNMRHKEPPPDTGHIRPSIHAKGILQPLLIRPEDEGFGIVFGRSRYYSAKEERAEGSTKFDTLPCVMMADGDDADGLEASIIENGSRKDPDPLTQCENFTHLIKMGRTIEGIAATFGLKTYEVKQRLGLAKLHRRIKALFRVKEIDEETLCLLTLATNSQQREWLELWDKGDAPSGRGLKGWLFGGAEIKTTAALFPLEQYKGQIVADLFSANSYFRDSDLFWELQQSAIAEKAEALKASGWAEVHVMEIGEKFYSWGLAKTPKKKGGHVYISTGHDGVVEINEGWLTQKEARAAEKAAKKEEGGAAEDAKPAKPRPAMTQTMENYLDLHRHALVRAALLDNPRTAFRLLIAHAAAASGNWAVKSDPQSARSEDVAASLKASPAQAAFETERKAVEALSGIGEYDGTEAAFAKLLKLTDAEVMRVAVFVMADTLDAGSDTVDVAGTTLGVDARKLWQPDAVFFDLIRDRITVNRLLAEIGGKPVAKANVAQKAKTQKTIIRDFLAGTNGRAKVEGWLPSWMEFPFRALGAKPKKPKTEISPIAIAAE
jgi:ParB family chromosome partitioning protein